MAGAFPRKCLLPSICLPCHGEEQARRILPEGRTGSEDREASLPARGCDVRYVAVRPSLPSTGGGFTAVTVFCAPLTLVGTGQTFS